MALRGLGRLVGVAAFTLVEAAALATWLGVVRGDVAPGAPAAVAAGVLFVGLVIEGVLADVTLNGASAPPMGAVLAVGASETALWSAWLFAADRVGGLVGVAAASAALLVLLVPQHTVETNVLRGKPPLSDVFDVGTLGFSLVEAAAAAVWLGFVRLDAASLAELDARGAFTTAGVGLPAGVELQASVDGGTVVGVAALALLLFVEHLLVVDFVRR